MKKEKIKERDQRRSEPFSARGRYNINTTRHESASFEEIKAAALCLGRVGSSRKVDATQLSAYINTATICTLSIHVPLLFFTKKLDPTVDNSLKVNSFQHVLLLNITLSAGCL